MRVRIRLVLAAVLSVVAIPIVALLVDYNHNAVISSAAALAAFLASTGAYWMSSPNRAGLKKKKKKKKKKKRKKKKKVRPRREATRAGIAVDETKEAGAADVEISEAETSETEPIEVEATSSAGRLLLELSAVERAGQTLLEEGQNVSVIRLRARLRELGVWSEDDVYDFDVALRTRNQIAHGDQEKVSRDSVARAIRTMERLRQKVQASQLREDKP